MGVAPHGRYYEVSTVFLLRHDGAALLQHRDDKPGLVYRDLWVAPGGHRAPGETAVECARREFHEETDYRCARLDFLIRFLDEVTDPATRVTVFWSRYDGVQSFECREGQDLRFVARDEVVGLTTPEFLTDLWDRALEAR